MQMQIGWIFFELTVITPSVALSLHFPHQSNRIFRGHSSAAATAGGPWATEAQSDRHGVFCICCLSVVASATSRASSGSITLRTHTHFATPRVIQVYLHESHLAGQSDIPARVLFLYDFFSSSSSFFWCNLTLDSNETIALAVRCHHFTSFGVPKWFFFRQFIRLYYDYELPCQMVDGVGLL